MINSCEVGIGVVTVVKTDMICEFTCCFGRECGGAGEASVDLDDAVLLAVRVECILDVALPYNAQAPNHLRG